MGISTDTDYDQIPRQKAENDPSPPLGPGFCFPDKLLEEIARTAQHLTAAGGAALALSDGKVISCRACAGYLTPPVGTELTTQSGLTGICLQTAEIMRCDDTHSDARVNGSRCQSIRSLLAVPIFNGSEVTGIFEVFSAKPKSFSDKHLAVLQLLARVVEVQVEYASRSSRKDLEPNDTSIARGAPLVGCLSCGQRNPQGSQFCNRCGVILSCSAPPTYDSNLDLTTTMPPIDREGLQRVYKLIAGDSGLATWSDIYAKFANLESSDKPIPAITSETDRKKDAKGFDKPGLKNDVTA